MRFLPIGVAFHWGRVHIWPEGLDTDDPALIKRLLKCKYYGVTFYAPDYIPPEKKPKREKKAKEEPKRRKKEEYPVVPPLTVPDYEVELRYAAEEEALKKTEAEEEAEKRVALQIAKEQEEIEGRQRNELRKSHRIKSKK